MTLASAVWLASAFVLLAPAQAAEPLEYAYPDISVWTTERDATGTLKNPLVKLADPLFEKAGIEWKPQAYPAKRMFTRLREGQSKFSMLVNAKKILAGCCLLSKNRVAVVEIRMYRRKGAPPVLTKDDLKGKNVITIRGYSYAGWRNFINEPANNITNNVAGDHFAAFAMLAAERADYVLDYAGPAEEVLTKRPIDDVTFDSVSQTDVFLILHKDYPNAEQVMRKLEEISKTLDVNEFVVPPGSK
ncbi:amino acid ABC transporter [Magnetovibrio sp. PR-2]|uniref:amino acid ABC transporter n=1 Tax=Magnetovibrio sp. PR-2 TaxID=3120356 RepID=UPI002FCE233B